jgi:tetratricopeptide (TPR) repeat protein
MAQFMSELFLASAPMKTPGTELTVEQVLDNGAQRVRTELVDQPELQASLLRVLGQTYFELGLYDRAEAVLLESLDVCELSSTRPEAVLAPALNQLADLYLDSKEPETIEPLVDRALALSRRVFPDDPYSLPDGLRIKGDLMFARGQDARALEYYREAAELARQTHGDNDPYYAYRLMYLAAGLRRTGSTEAEALTLRALEIQRATLEPTDPLIGFTVTTLGDYYENRQQLGRALEFTEQGLAQLQPVLGPDHPEVGGIHERLATIRLERGELDAAEEHASLALSIAQRHDSPTSKAVGYAKADQADLLFARGELAAARGLWEEVLAGRVAKLGRENWRTAVAQQKIALLDHYGGDHEAGLRRMTEALATLEAAQPGDHPRLGAGLARAAAIHLGTASAAAAEEPLRRAIEIWRTNGLGRSAVCARTQVDYARALLASNRIDEAQQALEEAREILDELNDTDPCPRYTELTADQRLVEGLLDAATGDDEAARARWSEALQLLENVPEEAVTGTHHLISALTLDALGREAEARDHARFLYERGWRWPEELVRLAEVGR